VALLRRAPGVRVLARSRPAPGRSRCRTAWRPRASAGEAKRGRVRPPSSKVVTGLGQRVGTAASRAAIFAAARSLSVGMRSNTDRTACSAPEITLSSLVAIPASYVSRASPRRSCMASRATCSASSAGVTRSSCASVRRSKSASAAYPSGESSVSRSSCPAMPDVGGADGLEVGPLVDVAVCDCVNVSHEARLTDE
jgi:hypothetical protein